MFSSWFGAEFTWVTMVTPRLCARCPQRVLMMSAVMPIIVIVVMHMPMNTIPILFNVLFFLFVISFCVLIVSFSSVLISLKSSLITIMSLLNWCSVGLVTLFILNCAMVLFE